MDLASLWPWFALRAVQEIGDAEVCGLVRTFGSPGAAMGASVDELVSSGGLSPSAARAVRRGPDDETRRSLDRELKRLERMRVALVTFLDPLYPRRLAMIPDPPPFLYVTGTLDQRDQQAVAIVGARRATEAGKLVTEELGRALASAGLTIVSGMARGIDAAAHRGALNAGGRTVAVLGCGIDRTYPPEHEGLRRQIEASGAVLTELPVGAYPHGYHFPRRNRIISGMSLGVVVAEAELQSGSLITARLAAEQGREVFAVPGSVRSANSRGPHGLIKQGANLVEQAGDVIEELLPQLDDSFRERLRTSNLAATQPGPKLEEREAALCTTLSVEPMHIDEVIARTGLPAADVNGLLLGLELKGLVRQLPGPSYIRV
ncbi:MAG: DNA-processing protein DprA [Nitrospirota bacterium]